MAARPLTWLVTGTSSGVGHALSAHILRQGHTLISISRQPQAPSSLVSVCTKPAQLQHLTLDLSQPTSIKPAVDEFLAQHAELQVDVLVNNAGVSAFGPLESMAWETMQRVVNTNFWAPLVLAQTLLPRLRKTAARGEGDGEHAGSQGENVWIVNISSTQGICTNAGHAVYDASKHALEGLMGALEQEVSGLGVRSVVVELGAFRTRFAGSGLWDDEDGWPSCYKEEGNAVAERLGMVRKYGSESAMGDANRAAEVLFGVVVGEGKGGKWAEKGERRLVLGSDAWAKVDGTVKIIRREVDASKEVANVTDFVE